MATNRLTRNPQHAILGGVCAGIADRLDIDLNLVRLITIVVAVVSGGIGVVVYVALWLIMPLPDAPPGLPSRDAITEELRVATDRAKEAADILSRAAKQAANELSEAAAKRSASAGAAAATAANDTPTEATSNMGMPSDASAAPQSETAADDTPPVVPPTNPLPYAGDDPRRPQEQ